MMRQTDAGCSGVLSEEFNRSLTFNLIKHCARTDLTQRREAAKPQSDELIIAQPFRAGYWHAMDKSPEGTAERLFRP
jgi:hypothetical protein